MNLETINKWLDEKYGCSYTRLEELHDFYFEKYIDLQQENKNLNGTIQTYNILLKSNVEENKRIKQQIEEYQKALDETMSEKIDLEDNWEAIKQYCLEEQIPEEYDEYNSYIEFSNSVYDDVLNKMKELEGSDNNE